MRDLFALHAGNDLLDSLPYFVKRHRLNTPALLAGLHLAHEETGLCR